MKTLYMGASPETVAPYVLFSGDPWRVDRLKVYLDNPQPVAFLREFNTCTGTYKGLPITVTSTGIGAPSAAIAMEEMYACGMQVAVRMGTVMSLKPDLLGHFMVPMGAVRRESTSLTYVEQGYPAVADLDLVNILHQVITDFDHRVDHGITCTMDGFYTQMHDSRFGLEKGRDLKPVFDTLRDMGVVGIDMESACLLTVGRLMGVKTAVVTLVTVLENLTAALTGTARSDAEDLLCRVALEGLYRYAGGSAGQLNGGV